MLRGSSIGLISKEFVQTGNAKELEVILAYQMDTANEAGMALRMNC